MEALQAEEVGAGNACYATTMDRLTNGCKNIQFYPVEIVTIAGGPDDRSNSPGAQVEGFDRFWVQDASGRLGGLVFGQCKPVLRGMGVSRSQEGGVRFVSLGQISRQVVSEGHRSVLSVAQATEQRHPAGGEGATIDRMTSISAANKHARQPAAVAPAQSRALPEIVLPPVAPGNPAMRADRQEDRPTGLQEFLGDLDTGSP
jgi:hypothetical protein